ncbi:MAG TPA: DDE-type integrase/transposase/recombinase [Acidimicrobiales bacterium]|nr:DDE-type integrase/transposase/recombinase [Acidimicrobiales bacterium]
MTRDQIIYQRRCAVLAHAAKHGNVAETCRIFGVSRTRFYEWQGIAERYGVEALMPKARRRPQLPNATPTHVLEVLLTLAVLQPTLGCRQLADRLADRGFSVSKTTVNKLLAEHGLARRHQRVARAAAVAAAGGLITRPAAKDPIGFCHWAARPGDLVALDGFYIGNLKGVGRVYQLTAVDTATRWAMVWLIAGTPNQLLSTRFVEQIVRRWRRHGVTVRAVLTDNGPEWVGGGFAAALAAKNIRHHRIPPRSPNHNAVVERFHGTILDECWRPAFHRRAFTSLGQLRAEADTWLLDYNHRRRNHGDYMQGRTPAQALRQLKTR